MFQMGSKGTVCSLRVIPLPSPPPCTFLSLSSLVSIHYVLLFLSSLLCSLPLSPHTSSSHTGTRKQTVFTKHERKKQMNASYQSYEFDARIHFLLTNTVNETCGFDVNAPIRIVDAKSLVSEMQVLAIVVAVVNCW